MKLCKLISDHLKLEVLDMRIKTVLDIKEELQMIKNKKASEQKKANFVSIFNLLNGVISKPVHCGKGFWRELGDK